MASKYPSIGSSHSLAAEALRTSGFKVENSWSLGETGKRVQSSIECDFYSSSGDSWSSRNCHEAAEFIEAYEKDGTLVPSSNTYSRLRCARHRAVNERTAKNRGWGGSKYLPFDAAATAKSLAEEAAARKAAEKDDASHRAAQVAAQVILDTLRLDATAQGILRAIADENTLFGFDLVNPRSK